MYWQKTIPQLRYAQQPCRARAPFVRFADIFPATGEICPLHKGAFGGRQVAAPTPTKPTSSM